MPLDTSIKKVLVIGSGPIVIGQAAEFDYAGAQACRILKEAGVDVVLCNSNPATIMTDQAMADEIYLEPLTTETIKRIIKKEKPDSILAGLGGQTGLTLAMQLDKEGFLEEQGVRLLGTDAKAISRAEDRELFKEAMAEIGQPVIASDIAETVEGALEVAERIGYPVIVRPAFTLGGAGGGAGIGGKHESGAGNIEITGGTIKAEGGEGAAGIGGGVYGIGHDIEISGGKVSATGGDANENLDPSRPGAAGIGDGAGTEGREIDPDAPPSNPDNPNHIIISGDAEVEAKAGASTGGKTAAIGGGDVGEISNDALSDDDHKVTGGSLTRYDPDGNKKEDYSYDRRTPSQPEQPDKPEQPDDTENNDDEDDEDDAPDTQAGEVPGRVKQMYETTGVITHPDGTQELGDVATAEYDPVNKVLRFDAHGTLFRMTGDSLRELAEEVHELRIRFLDGEGREMEAVIPLARIKDLVGMNGAFELELSHEGRYRFHVVGQTGYDRKTFSDETVLRQSGKELILVYRVGDEEQKAQETARVEEAIARRKQEKEQWGTVLSGREGGSLSGLPGLTQPGTGTVGDLSGLTTLSPDSLTTAPQPKQPASDQTVWKTFTGNIVKLVGGKQDSKKDDPAPSVGDLSGLPTLSPDSLTTAPQPEQAAAPGPEDSIRIPLLEDEEKITIQPFTEKTPAEEQTEAGPRGQQGRRDDSARQTEAGPRGQQGRRDDPAQQTEAGPRGAQAGRDGDKTGEPRGPRGRHAGRGN